MATKNLKDKIKEGIPMLLDGALGTELYNRGVFINRCFEDANLNNPNLVLTLHKEYINSGAQAISTNSWGANFLKLRAHNLHDQVEAINIKAAELAKTAVGDKEVWILGSVGPLGVRIEPFGPTSFDEAKGYFKKQIGALIEGGVDGISLETFSDISELQQAIQATRELSKDIPIIAYGVIREDGNTHLGTPLEWVIKKLDEWDVDVIGLNCSVGPVPMMNCVEKIKTLTKKPLSMKPNAGLPKLVDGRQIYMSTPEYMAHFAQEFFQAGVLMVGGCCGTSPEHIKAMSNTMRYASATQGAEHKITDIKLLADDGEKPKALEKVPLRDKSKWSHGLATGEKVYSIELLPPNGIDPSKILERSQAIKDAGIHAINIPDGPRASARMSAVLTSVMIEQKIGIETVLHYTCRDRNLLGMQSDMLGAQAIGLRNMLLITGDPPKLGNYPDVTGVFDVDAIGLIHMVNHLNQGIDLGGGSIGKAASLSVGVGVNPGHRDFDYEMKRFAWKVDAGAEWAITQPVFDTDALFKFLDYIHKHNLSIPIVAGIWPLTSLKNAIFMNNEVPGVIIPDSVMERMAHPNNPEDAKKIGVEIAQEMVETMGNNIQGVQVSAPFGRIDLALNVIGK